MIDNNNSSEEGLIFFPSYLQQAGYQTGFFGKWHIGNDTDALRTGFDKWVSFRRQGTYFPTDQLSPAQIAAGERQTLRAFHEAAIFRHCPQGPQQAGEVARYAQYGRHRYAGLGRCGEAEAGSARDDIVVTARNLEYRTPDTSALKLDAPLRDIPQTIDIIPDQVVRDQRALSMQDAVKNVAGIDMATGDGQRDQFVIRGNIAYGDLFIDGVRDDVLISAIYRT